jgi:hypothetical protein
VEGQCRRCEERRQRAKSGDTLKVIWTQILPLAFVMIAGPQIITSFFLATSENWAKASVAFIGGAALGIVIPVTIAYVVGRGLRGASGGKHSGTVGQIIDWVVLALLVFLAARSYLKRHESQPPKWLSGLEKESPKGAFLLGLALLSVFPTDIASNVVAGLHVSRHGAPWWQILPFVGLTVLLLAVPSLMIALLGKRAKAALPKIRDWMSQNAWVVSEIVLVFLAALTIKSLVAD